MIIEGGRTKYPWGFRLIAIVFNPLIGSLGKLIAQGKLGYVLEFSVVLCLILAIAYPGTAQDCDVDFPGVTNKNYSNECAGSTINNMSLGMNQHLDDNDIFTFDSPATINIQGNLYVFAEGDGRIVIPTGVTVNIDGNMEFEARNGGCKPGNPCMLTIVVNGYLQITGNLENLLVSLVWEGTGTVEVMNRLENLGIGCMSCGISCPYFPVGAGGCVTTGAGCPTDFCNTQYGVTCAVDNIDPILSNCPIDIVVSASSVSCDAMVNWTPPTPSDNCTIAAFTESHNPGDTFPVGISTVSYKVDDANGNSSSCIFTIEVIDNTVPIISNCPADLVISVVDCGNTAVSWIPPSVADNCTIVSSNTSHVPGQLFPMGVSTVTYTTTDINGNSASCSFQVEVIDDIDPVISNCPIDITTSASAGCNTAVNWMPPIAADNCNLTSFTSSHSSGDTFPIGLSQVTYTAIDDVGNTGICSFFIEVIDSTAPVISGCPVDINISASDCTGAILNWTAPTAIDNCAVTSFAGSHSPGDLLPLGLTTVIYTATDKTGNIATCSFSVIVVDDVGPAITNCPTDMTISVNDCANSSVTWTPPIVSDNCNVASFISSHNPGDTFPLGFTTVMYTAIDDNGNTATCSFQVELIDYTDPVISNCPADIQVSTSGINCEVQVSWAPPVANDNCSLLSFTSSHQPGDLYPLGITTVTYTATDMSGNSATCILNVSVSDQVPPQISNCPVDILVPGFDPGENTAVVTWTEPIADDCSLAEFTSSHNSGSTFSKGSTLVTYIAVDMAGNQQTCSFTIEVRDNHYPAAENVYTQTYSGEPVRICFDASDSDGHGLTLGNIDHNSSLGLMDQIDPAQHCFVYTPAMGSTGLVRVTATICDDRNPVACVNVQAEIEVLSENIVIYKAFSPNGDGINDVWHVGNIEQYPINSVIIFDRWGSVIYEATGYNNENIVWDGRGNGRGVSSNVVVSAGTYFYSIKLEEAGSKSGYVELIN